jgi:predicted RND superfamily exporter protein
MSSGSGVRRLIQENSSLVSEFVTQFLIRRRRALLAAVCLVSLVSIFFAVQVRFDNSIEIWFLEDDPGLAVYEEFSNRFNADQIAVIGIFDANVFAPGVLSAIDRITEAVQKLDHVSHVQSLTNTILATRLEQGFRNPGFRRTVTASPNIVGTLVSGDGTAASILVYYSRSGAAVKEKYRFVSAMEEIVARETRATGASFALTGAPVMGKEGQDKNRDDMRTSVPAMILVILLVTFGLYRSVWMSLLPLAVAAVAVLWSFSVMAMLGWHMTMISAMLMPLILAVGVADSIHFIARYRRQLELGRERLEALGQSVSRLLKPCFFTTVTTMVGLLSLLVCDIAPVREFGIIAAVGVLSAFVLSISLVPALLVSLPASPGSESRTGHGALEGFLAWAGRLSKSRPRMVMALTLAATIVLSWFSLRINVGLDPLTWFPPEDPFRLASEKVDHAFGGSLSMEFMVSTPDKNLNDPEVLGRLDEFESWLVANTAITRTYSVVEMVKEAARVARHEGVSGYSLPRTHVITNALLGRLQRDGLLENWVLPDFSSARISARIPVAATREIVAQSPSISEYIGKAFPDDALRVQMTGHAVLVGQMQEYVIHSQVISFSVALVGISILMLLLLKSLPLGLLAVISNLVPLVAGLGAMALLGIDLNPGTVMITAVALGIVVDDTVHFMVAVKRELQGTADISLAIERAVMEAGRPIVATSILLALGFSVMLLGSFLPSREIGGICALIVLVALLADMILVPAAMRLLPARWLA